MGFWFQLPEGGLLLAADEVGVNTGLGNQLLVPALGGDASAAYHGNVVRPGDGGEPVGDDDDRFVRHQPGHGLLDDRFVFRVDIGCGLIQNDNGDVFNARKPPPGGGGFMLAAPHPGRG